MDGESAIPGDSELIANLGWVQRLALSLARDRDGADDLAQDLARLWLEKRPAHADGPRGWLASVARKLALDRARSEASRRARERTVSRPEGESFEVVERGARQRRVALVVMRLAEPYRSTILYRYLDGLETREVAERMGVPEATVRKRVERGLALLRERLDREFGSRSSAWAVALLEPGLRVAVFKGVGWMSFKSIAAACVVVLLAGVAWFVHESSASRASEAIGGTGVVVPMEVAAAREQQPPVDSSGVAADARRVPLQATQAAAKEAPGLRGFIYIDDRHDAPADIRITNKREGSRTAESARAQDHPSVEPRVDAATASWSLDTLDGEPAGLWITSSSTVPALIPVPAELWANGGVFDLHLTTGRSLSLTFLDRVTKQPLPYLEFQLSRAIELERSQGRVLTDGNQTRHRTDAQGKAFVTGLPLAGVLSVTVDFSTRVRDVVMRGGKTFHSGVQRNPDWSTWLEADQPGNLEETVLVSPPLGEGCAGGQVPAWAVAKAGSAESVRVVARETTNETPQKRGMPFLLPQDELGHFELCSETPSSHTVWLEKQDGGERLSAETELAFAQPGAQEPISFQELQGTKVTLSFVHVPKRGELQAQIVGKRSMAPPASQTCTGVPFSREFTLAANEQIQLSLRLGTDAHDKSCWARMVKIDDARKITVDLSGCERRVRIECPERGAVAGEGAIGFIRCEGGQVGMQETVVVLCAAGNGATAVHVPSGRWFYRYEDKQEQGIWGVVDVATGTESGEELLLRPRVRLVPAEELGAGVRFDEIDGINLANLPAEIRTLRVKTPEERIAVPIDSKYTALEKQ